ncbi:CLUMA_CG007468, isoform A [Clunio marinus]|uniref:CLUMA_CG007468, isoform A n=1 Tax=Clunio marinus TaxID=568069 RepID=A0A1J1I0Y8_9DIPT|nr:CLUMA_CG007468, isoform A [Clunio marinus]
MKNKIEISEVKIFALQKFSHSENFMTKHSKASMASTLTRFYFSIYLLNIAKAPQRKIIFGDIKFKHFKVFSRQNLANIKNDFSLNFTRFRSIEKRVEKPNICISSYRQIF